MSNEFFNAEELAERWKVSTGTLQNWRTQSRGPGYTKIEGKILYRKSDILEYEKKGNRSR